MKVISLEKASSENIISMCGFQYYKFRSGTEQYTSLTKPRSRGVLQTDLRERTIHQRGIPKKKKTSMDNLLSEHSGNDWKNDENLAWYNDLLFNQPKKNMEEAAEPCDYLVEENAVHVHI